jgi:carboxylate-amine ligase
MHVHVGIPSRSVALQVANGMRYFLPHLYALSTNSPFWEGRNTGFKSFRSKVFDKFPRTGIPEHFNSLVEYDRFIELLVKTNCIDNAKKIWWDIRVHPVFPTVEVRVCDAVMKVDEALAIAALVQALVAKLHKLYEMNCSFNCYSRTLINENKWRAGRYGIEGKLIDFGVEMEKPCKALVHEVLNFVEDVIGPLDSGKYLQYIETMLDGGTGADRQLAAFDQRSSLHDVVDLIISETKMIS